MMIKTFDGRPVKKQFELTSGVVRVILHEKDPTDPETDSAKRRGIRLDVSSQEYQQKIGEVFFPDGVVRKTAIEGLISKARR